MSLVSIFPVITLLIGWFLKEFSDLFQSKRERRKLLGVVVSDLLEVRDRMMSYHKTLDLLRSSFQIPPDAAGALSRIIESVVPPMENFQEKYEKTLALVAATDPVLAFRLRSRYMFNPMLSNLKNFAGANLINHTFAMKVESLLTVTMIKSLDEMIVELAQTHGKQTLVEVRKQLDRHSREPLPETNVLLKLIHEELLKKPEGSTITPPPPAPLPTTESS